VSTTPLPQRTYRHIFGPVPSRRLGRSLGVDLVALKTCSFNCVFCQVGRTPRTTCRRAEYVPVDDVIEEVGDWLNAGGNADVITLSGSGEPTLHTRFGEVLSQIRSLTAIPTVLLTNSSLLHLREVREGAGHASIVKASLSAWDPASFVAVNRPDAGVRFEDVVGGLQQFRAGFSGDLWLEVFALSGVNTDEDGMRRIAEIACGIRPDRIHLNTVVRPPAEASALPVSLAALERLAGLFTPRAEVIATFKPNSELEWRATEQDVLGLLTRRPCSVDDVAGSFDRSREDALRTIERLLSAGKIEVERRGGAEYYGVPQIMP
jgi:wyosine [tRNA(Phe)-imidazoG37] synthetase (radical SAM superfamily)